MHGLDDNLVTFSHSFKLYEAFNGPCNLLKLTGGHNNRRGKSVI